MQLTADTLDSFKAGRFEDFLDDGAVQLQRMFPDRFTSFADADVAHDAARNVVGLSYERVSALGRRSGLLAMRLAFLRAAYGIGVLDDPRYAPLHALVNAQAAATASIKPNTSIGTYLTAHKDHWHQPPLARGAQSRPALLSLIERERADWPLVIDHLSKAHQSAGTGITPEAVHAFVEQCYRDAVTIGFETTVGVQVHALMADAYGLHYFDDPLLPDWGARYRDTPEAELIPLIMARLRNEDT
ncbi:MAG: hypothetical protein AAFQ59_11665 [Pseudomonadota bacterium]